MQTNPTQYHNTDYRAKESYTRLTIITPIHLIQLKLIKTGKKLNFCSESRSS